MPGGDRTGPMGTGPMTGRGAGFCAGYDVPGYMNHIGGRGFGGGRGARFGRGFGGGGRGWRHQYYATGVPGWARGSYFAPPQDAAAPAAQVDELAFLKEQAGHYRQVLEDLERRVDELQNRAANADTANADKQ